MKLKQSWIGDEAEGAPFWWQRKIGKGEYSDVYVVMEPNSKTLLAAKVAHLDEMSEQAAKCIEREVEALQKLSHPNIIHYVDSFVMGRDLILLTEFADGGDLETLLWNRKCHGQGPYGERESSFIFIQLAAALVHLHGEGMLHRDIKPANIFLTTSGLAKLGDFGFVECCGGTVDDHVTQDFFGTPYYMAPEVWKREMYGKKADMWSLGVVLFEMLIGTKPFTAPKGGMIELRDKILGEDCTGMLADKSPALQNLLVRLLMKNPEDRPTALQLFRDPEYRAVQEGLAAFKRIISHDTSLGEVRDTLLNAAESLLGDFVEEVVLEGSVYKLGKGKWREKHLALRGGCLALYSRGGQPHDWPLSDIIDVSPAIEYGEDVFRVEGTVYGEAYIKAPNAELMRRWVDAIRGSI